MDQVPPRGQQGVVLLTHAHSDSYGPLRAHVVWCSVETAWLLRDHRLGKAPKTHSLHLAPAIPYCVVPVTPPRGVETPGLFTVKRYRTGRHCRVTSVFIPFATEHCLGSLGFWFPREGVLYVGDSRYSEALQASVQSLVGKTSVYRVVADTLWAQHDFPSLTDSTAALQRLLVHLTRRYRTVKLVCPHSGSAWVLGFLSDVCWAVDETAAWSKVDVLRLARHLAPAHCTHRKGAVVVSSTERCTHCTVIPTAPAQFVPYEWSARAHQNTEATVVVSSAWFLLYGLDPSTVYYSPPAQIFRVFTAFHANQTETQALRAQFPRAVFTPAPTRPFRS